MTDLARGSLYSLLHYYHRIGIIGTGAYLAVTMGAYICRVPIFVGCLLMHGRIREQHGDLVVAARR